MTARKDAGQDPALILARQWLDIESQFAACDDDDALIDALGDRQAQTAPTAPAV